MLAQYQEYEMNCRIIGALKSGKASARAIEQADFGVLKDIEIDHNRPCGKYTFYVAAKSEKEAIENAQGFFDEIWESVGIDCGDMHDTDVSETFYGHNEKFRCSNTHSLDEIWESVGIDCGDMHDTDVSETFYGHNEKFRCSNTHSLDEISVIAWNPVNDIYYVPVSEIRGKNLGECEENIAAFISKQTGKLCEEVSIPEYLRATIIKELEKYKEINK